MSVQLTNKEKIFIEAYLELWNANEAARRAGYSSPTKQGWQVLQKPHIQEAIRKRLKEAAMDADEVLARIAQQARADMSRFLTTVEYIDKKTGAPKTRIDIDWEFFKHHGYLVKKLSWNKFGEPIIELHDAQNALVQIGRAHGVFKDRTTNIDIDLSKLSDDQLERIANGEDPIDVVTSTRES